MGLRVGEVEASLDRVYNGARPASPGGGPWVAPLSPAPFFPLLRRSASRSSTPAAVDTIEASYTVINHADFGDGVERTVVGTIVQVLVGPDTGWFVETFLDLETVPGDDGFLRIRAIEERESIGIPRTPDEISVTTFGRLKASYDTESPQP